MKYYTPDLLFSFGSDNLKVAKTARQKLEKQADEYVAQLDVIRHKLPPKLAELLARFYLHDARVVMPCLPWLSPKFMMKDPLPWWDPLLVEKNDKSFSSFIMVLQLDTPPQEFLVLHYRFVTVEEVSQHPALVEGESPSTEWLHDEINLIPSNDLLMIEQSILFTNGLELRLRFQDFDYATLSPLGDPSKKKAVTGAKH